MARYFFDIHNSKFSSRDTRGQECVGPDAVSEYALRLLCDVARERPLEHMHSRLGATVRDESDDVVLTATVSMSTTWLDAA
ncbi:DUF6894 family protein [Methylobacterium durans]|uniref:DUF6894 domain-containing protein n=1 Tax=Methylobacterium durans TaxID=2202825 RepID=A0A2U8WCE9_9HYPH|nr:hypothetical protein [Methylobacterium durans]AWN43278.1 hypothetical protein DK389_25705 [Methylobacterium durans]